MPPADSAPAAPAGHSGSGTMTLTRVSVPTTGVLTRGLAAVTRHPLDARHRARGDGPWRTGPADAIDREVAPDRGRGGRDAGRIGSARTSADAPWGFRGLGPRASTAGPGRSSSGREQAKPPRKKGATPAGGESRG